MSNFQDIIDFLGQHPPFNQVSADALTLISTRIQIAYIKAGEDVQVNNEEPCLRVIRSGSVEVRSAEGVLLDRLSTGGCFGYGPLLTGDDTSRKFTVLEDGLLFLVSQDDFSHLRHNFANFDYFFARETRRRAEAQNKPISKDLELDLAIAKIMRTDLVCATPDQTVRTAAQYMTKSKVSSILICNQGNLQGIITDRDLRTRVIAQGMPTTEKVTSIMTANPVNLSPNSSVHQAYLAMMTQGIHHLPITDDGKVVGIVTLSDLIRSRNSEPLFLIKAINRTQTVKELQEISTKFPNLIEKLVLADVTADEIGRIISVLTDNLTVQLIKFAQNKFGAIPCGFAWLAFGSQGRKEQTLNSDQDNSLLLDESASQNDIKYFLQLAKFVCDGLNACGIPHCPGNIMAMNPKWCLSLNQWQNTFYRWINNPDPNAVLNTSIFFDMRFISGDKTLFDELQKSVLNKAKDNSIFLFYLLEGALSNSPPLGFFKTFVLERDGNHNSVLDLKHRGTAPIVDLARLYALSQGIYDCNTQDRLRSLKKQRILHPETADNLSDALKFIAELRLDNQQKQLMGGKSPTNNLDPQAISPLMRHQLKDAFAIVQDSQQSAKLRFGRGAL